MNPHANTDWGHLGLALSDCGTSSASTKSSISCDSGVLALNDSDLLICLDIKIKDTQKRMSFTLSNLSEKDFFKSSHRIIIFSPAFLFQYITSEKKTQGAKTHS